MTSEHDDIRDLMAAVALGAATPDEVARVEAAAAADPGLAAELESLRQATDLLATDVPVQEPSPALRSRVMDAIRVEAAASAPAPSATPAPASGPGPRAAAGRRRAQQPGVWRGWRVVAAVAAVAAVALLVVNIALLGRADGDGTRTIDVVAAEDPLLDGAVVVYEDEDRAVMRVSGLPEPTPGRGYELWIVADGAPVSAGFMDPTPGGDFVAVAEGVGPDDVLAVTEEPLTNRVAPTSPPLASAEL